MTRKIFVTTAMEYLGFPASNYNGPENGITIEGFDCSGWISFLLKKLDFPETPPRHCNTLFDDFGVLIHEDKVERGDLVFFSNRNKGTVPDHVGIMISSSEFIHSPGKNGEHIKISKLIHQPIKLDEAIGLKQIYVQNPIGFKRLAVQKGRYKEILP
jgi:cell wall-associated NlpC family hydrolase